ncbi:MAG: YfhO family protein, partial [Anaerolineae bacterium]|nr:YfhO family protein [Anaerolineae bacterium]
VGGLIFGLVGGVVWADGEVEKLIALWWWLPLPLALGAGALLWLAPRVPKWSWALLACFLVWADLYAYGAVLGQTYNATWPRERVERPPRALSWLKLDLQRGRLFTKEEILPVLSVMKESFYPNIALQFGLPSANVYLPLVPQTYEEYLAELSPQRLNKLAVKYYLIPQLLPVDASSELYDVLDPFAALPLNRWLKVVPQEIVGLRVESYLSHSAALSTGEPVAELYLRDQAGGEQVLVLRAGKETAEWAYERDDVRKQIAHARAPVARSWPARSGFPPREHLGHTYMAHLKPERCVLTAIRIHPLLPQAFVRIEKIYLLTPSGQQMLLNHLLNLGNHSIVYRNEDVLIYRNEDALPRAYTLPTSILKWQGRGIVLPGDLSPDAVGPVEIVEDGEERLSLRVQVSEPSYLILADLYYPGWYAWVDGVQVPIVPADGLFRAVSLPPGEHYVVFRYRPYRALWDRR